MTLECIIDFIPIECHLLSASFNCKCIVPNIKLICSLMIPENNCCMGLNATQLHTLTFFETLVVFQAYYWCILPWCASFFSDAIVNSSLIAIAPHSHIWVHFKNTHTFVGRATDSFSIIVTHILTCLPCCDIIKTCITHLEPLVLVVDDHSTMGNNIRASWA